MIANVDAIKAIITQHGLRNVVILDMDRRKQHQAEGSTEKCCEALDMVSRLMPRESFRVEAWKSGNGETADTPSKGGKRAKLAPHFEWVVQPLRDGGNVPMVVNAPDSSPAVLEAIRGLSDRLDAMEDAGPEPERAPMPEPPWLRPALDRAFAVVDVVLARLGAPAPPASVINGLPPSGDVKEDELMRAILRAKNDPANAGYMAAIVAQYGDAAAAKAAPAK